jgi:hypothetical protein
MGVIVGSVPWLTAHSWVANSTIERNPATGHLWTMVQFASTTFRFYKSIDNGANWTLAGTDTQSGVTSAGEIRFDASGTDLHWVWVNNSSSRDRIQYKRIPVTSGSADTGTTGSQEVYSTPALSPGDTIIGIALQPYRASNGDVHLVVAQTFAPGGSSNSGCNTYVVTVKNDAGRTTTNNSGMITGTRGWSTNGDTNLVPSLDIEHTGDGYTSSTPNIWLTWEAKTAIYVVKFAWGGSSWSGPSSPTSMKSGAGFYRDGPCRWDGSRLLVPVINPSDNSKVDLHERNKANTSTTSRTTPAVGTGVFGSAMVSYNHVTKDTRVFAANATTIYYIDYNRAAGTWGSWTAAIASTPPGDTQRGYAIRRSTAGNYQYDYVQHDGTGTSNWRYISVPVNFAPNPPTWELSSGKYGPIATTQAYDVAGPLFLNWAHNDPTGQAQGSYALSRQIGAAAPQYWRASDSTWQAAEVQNSSATTSLSLAAASWVGAGGASDATHVYKVKTWDASNAPSVYSTGQNIIPSTHVDPTLTAPAHLAVIIEASVTATWTVTEQSSYRITLSDPIAVDEFGRSVSSGWGTADYGGAWTTSGGSASDYSTTGTAARHSHAAVNTAHETKLGSVNATDMSLRLTVTAAAVATGGSVESEIRMRYADANNFIGVRLLFAVGGAIQLIVRQVKAGTETASGTATVFGFTGAGPHALRIYLAGNACWAKLWAPALQEPEGWDVSLQTLTLTDPGPVAIRSILTTGNTNTPPFLLTYDSLTATPPSIYRHDSGYVADPTPTAPSVLSYTPDLPLADGQAVLLYLATRNAEGLLSPARLVLFTVDYIEPATPVIAAVTPDADDGGIYVTVTQPAPSGGQPATTRLDLYRRPVGADGPGARVAAELTAGVPVLDWRAVSGVPYEYAPLAVGANGTVVTGSWQT